MNEIEPKIEVNINGVLCTIIFLKEDNKYWKDDVLRILNNNCIQSGRIEKKN